MREAGFLRRSGGQLSVHAATTFVFCCGRQSRLTSVMEEDMAELAFPLLNLFILGSGLVAATVELARTGRRDAR